MINLPKDLLEPEQLKVMPALEKESYVNKILKKILELNSNGTTGPIVSKALGINATTIWRHLEKLTSTREAYKLNFGKTTIYFPNGKMIHHFKYEDISLGDKIYSFYYVINNFGEFLYLQEKKQDRLGAIDVIGGLMIPIKELGNFVRVILNSSKEIKEIKRTNKG